MYSSGSRRFAFAVSACAALSSVPRIAAAERALEPRDAPSPPPSAEDASRTGGLALATGFAIAGVSLVVGSQLLTLDDDLDTKHAGLYVATGGLAVAPFAAHAVGGEWLRGAVFAVPPALAAAGMVALLAQTPVAPLKGRNKSENYYPVLLSLGVVGSAIGIFDAALIDERRRRIHFGAQVTPELAAATLGGAW